MKKLLFMLDTDAIPNSFDVVVAYDGGADHVTTVGGMNPETVGKIIDGAIFTRSPKTKKNTALFVTGSDMTAGEALMKAVKNYFFADFRVSVMLDSNGSNTTAAAAAACITRHVDAKGKKAVILAGTGPVGQRAGVMLANEGAEVVLTSRKKERADAAAEHINGAFGTTLTGAGAATPEEVAEVLDGAHICVATGAAGVQLLAESGWESHPTLEVLVDANATPPLGIEGVGMMDRGVEKNGKICYGAIGFGALKLELHRACVGKLFEANDQVFDAEQIYAVAKEMVKDY